MGDIPEERMVKLMWPGGIQPETAKPIFIMVNTRWIGTEEVTEEVFAEATLITGDRLDNLIFFEFISEGIYGMYQAGAV